jgi:carbamoyl-phosphate synthase small subunit
MTGYQEIYTDPSYYGQVIVSTNAHIGNYGVLSSEQESASPTIRAIVVNEFTHQPSRKRADNGLNEYLESNGVVGITGLDTRKIVRHIRSKGAMNAVISSELSDPVTLKEALDEVPDMKGLELASVVSTTETYHLGNPSAPIKIAVLDYGIKSSILKNLTERDCYIKVFPAKSTLDVIEEWNPDGYFLSNGPGDPAVMDYAIETTKQLITKGKPVFGICLGHQIICLAAGLDTFKMHHGHRGLNHPVKNLINGSCEITSQNHGFAVSPEKLSAQDNLELTHLNLNDDTVEGVRFKDRNVFSVQYHPESSPGPHDSHYLFDEFIAMFKS